MAHKEFIIKKGAVIYSQGFNSVVLDVQGDSGQLFSVTDNLVGLLHSVSDISGIPIMEVYSDDRVLMGTYGSHALEINGSDVLLPNIQAAITDTDKFLVLDGNIIKTRTGTQILSDIGGQPLLTNPVTGTGTAGQVSFWNGVNTQTGDSGLFWDNTNKRLGVGTSSPAAKLVSAGSESTVFKALILRNGNGTDGSSATIDFETSAGTQGIEAAMAGRIAGLRTSSGTSGALTFSTTNNGVLAERLRITSAGNVGIGTTTDAGFRLDVNGTTRIVGQLRLQSTITNGTSTYTLPSATGTLALTSQLHDAVTLGTANGLSLSGQVLSLGLASTSTNGALSSTDWNTFNNKQNALTNPVTGTGTAGQVSFWTGAGTQGGNSNFIWDNTNFRITSRALTVFGGTGSSYSESLSGEGSLIIQGSSRTLGNNTAQLGLGRQIVFREETSPRYSGSIVQNVAVIRAEYDTSGTDTISGSHALTFSTFRGWGGPSGGVLLEKWRITSTGILQSNGAQTIQTSTGALTLQSGGRNVLINTTTDAGFRLDVNGTARVQGNLNVSTGGITLTGAQTIQTSTGNLTLATGAGNGNILLSPNGTGKVGIGTSSPSHSLHIFSTTALNHIKIDGTAGINRNLNFSTSNINRWNIYATAAAESGANVGSDFTIARYNDAGTFIDNPLFIKRSTGNVGIGTTTPSVKLDVNGTAAFAGTTTFNGGANTLKNTGELQWRDSGGTARNVLFMFSDNSVYLSSPVSGSSLIFRGVDFNERMRITSTGNVGIGTTAPNSKLEVAGNAAIGYTTPAPTNGLIVNGNVGIGTSSPAVRLVGRVLSLNDSQSSIELLNNQSSAGEIFSNSTGTVLSEFRNLPMQFRANNIERMRITSAGNVGIGTTVPSQKLEVYGNQRISDNGILEFFGGTTYPQIKRNSSTGGLIIDTSGAVASANSVLSIRENNGADYVTVRGNGNVGIGTTTPNSKLEVAGNAAIGYTTAAPTNGLIVNGNVGIGTTSPIDKLHIVGGITSTSLSAPSNTSIGSLQIGYDGTNGIIRTWNSSPLIISNFNYQAFVTSGSERMRITSAGNVGIGTSSPLAKLQVGASTFSSEDVGIVPSVRIFGAPHSSTDSTLLRLIRDTNSGISYGAGVDFKVNAWDTLGSGDGYLPHTRLTFALKSTWAVTETANVDVMSLLDNGNVGIGTTAPSEKLHIAGSVRIGTISNATGNLLTTSATGVIQQRTAAEVRSDIGAGTVTSVAAGNGMTFATFTGVGTVTMGTPGTLTASTSNGLTADSHTHAITSTTTAAANTIVQTDGSGMINGNGIGVVNTSATTGRGIALYGNATTGQPTYGLMFAGTATFGTYGVVTADWATYFTMNNTAGRGWIFKTSTGTAGNVASISTAGAATFADTVNASTFNATSLTGGGFQGIDADTAAVPSFTWSGDLDTGMWRSGVDTIGFTTAGINRVSVSTTAVTSTLNITAPTFIGALSGNATTATTLQTARTINGTSFNGSANITTANWGTARTITIGSTGKSVNGSANVSWSLTEIGAAASSHNQAASTITAGTFATGNFIFQGNLQINGQIHSPVNAKGNSGTAVTLNWNDGNIQTVTMTGNATFTFSNPQSGASYQIIITQDATGSRTITWPTIKWKGGVVPTLTGTANSIDIVTLTYDGASYFGTISKGHV